MDGFRVLADYAYSRFFLRDVLGKIVPGSLVLLALVVRVTGDEPAVVVDNAFVGDHVAIVLLALGLAWILAFAAQAIREVVEWLLARCGCIDVVGWPAAVAERSDWTDKHRNGALCQELERQAVVKEATGNLAVAVAGLPLFLWRCGWVWVLLAVPLLFGRSLYARSLEVRLQAQAHTAQPTWLTTGRPPRRGQTNPDEPPDRNAAPAAPAAPT